MSKSTISGLIFVLSFTFLVIGCKQETVISFEAKNEDGIVVMSETDCDYVDADNGNIRYRKDGTEHVEQFEDEKIEVQKTQREKFILLPDSKYSTIVMIGAAISTIVSFLRFVVFKANETLIRPIMQA